MWVSCKTVHFEEIVVSQFNKVFILGINLPNNSNALNDSALVSLNNELKAFNENPEYSVAVLHGIGGDFCTGLQKSANKVNAEEVIKTMFSLRKPTVACVTGITVSFGFQLAVLCDMRIMEIDSVLGLNHKTESFEMHPLVLEKLMTQTNIAGAVDLLLVGHPLHHTDCQKLGLINRAVECGTCLGKGLKVAASIAKSPLEEIIKKRDLIYSYKTISMKPK
ncbi:UNVERIFIED_CONTAM: hypothetical protein PYX00_005803 [Menopon gallinae]|uniref:Uncharacterized protein n=1 Tax=Menopon gallinae TaxID=328185 RepID=A0AAW2HTZ8_9NEOP